MNYTTPPPLEGQMNHNVWVSYFSCQFIHFFAFTGHECHQPHPNSWFRIFATPIHMIRVNLCFSLLSSTVFYTSPFPFSHLLLYCLSGIPIQMGTDLSLYRAAIGNFSAKSFFFFRANLCALPFHILIWVYTSMIILGKLTCCFTQYLFLRSRRVTFSTFSPSSKKSIYLSWLFFFSLINRILLIIGGIESNPGDSPPPHIEILFCYLQYW